MSIYKDCDIRGLYSYEFTDATAYKIGRAIAYIREEKEVLVCGDLRASTPALKEKLIEGLQTGGAKAYDMGNAPTPVFTFAKAHYGIPLGVMVTGGNSKSEYNGFKIIYQDYYVTPEEIQKIRSTIEKVNFPFLKGEYKAMRDYKKEYLRDVFMKVKKGKLKIVFDCANTLLEDYVPPILTALGHEVICTKGELLQFCEDTLKHEAYMGVYFSSDAGRVTFIDEKGQVLNSENVFGVFAKDYLKENDCVVYDEKCSNAVKKIASGLGVVAISSKTGYTFMQRAIKENDAVLGVEASGHYYFAETGYDDSIFAVAKLAQIADTMGKPLSQLVL